ncbi:MAG TPA: NADH:flavin oxidoreductase/NADH oxidase [Propionicimonas sp.]|nr:NADH:flavin oxidoreductase/NADH oxidase [Propionicimonas sp.]HRA07838.1 NADH:flavin oxidoreductase/NADH oxidase [Propionicimonas sp.]
MSSLFDSLQLRDVTIPNRIFLAPMCQYQAVDGMPNDWHLVHYGARAAGGFGLVIAEATGVLPEGRITPNCCGLWNDEQAAAWQRIVDFGHSQGAKMAVQLQHAGRKASVYRDFEAGKSGSIPLGEGGWETIGPSAIPFPGLVAPREATQAEIDEVVAAFAAAAQRADAAGFDAVEVHAAHGYLIFQFLSPLSNHRTDGYGGDLTGRSRMLLEVVDAIRAVWPAGKPLLVRISATEWVEGGFTLEEATEVARLLGEHGVDLVDVSSGGNVLARIPADPGYQVPLAAAVRKAGVPVSAVGRITEPAQAQAILDEGLADVVSVGRVALREPSWPLRAAAELDADSMARYPDSYQRGRWPAIEPVR